MKIKSKILSAFIAGTVAATSFCGVVSAKANGGDIDSLIEAANASNDKFSISVKSTGIPATDVEMQDDGYCALTNFVESISDDSLSAENVSRKRQIALIDTNGEFVFPYENNRIHNYYYLDGVVSKCDNGNYAFSFKNWKDSEWLTDPELGGCEYYTSDGKVLFEHEPYISAKPINDGNAVVYSFKDDSEDSDTTKIWRNVAIINKEGKNVFEQPEQYEYECPIMEGIRGVLYGWCSEGMIPFRSDLVFDDGKITYKEDRDRSDKSCGYMDISGNVVITQKFDNAAPFFGNHAVVRDDGKYGIINKNGEYIIEPQYEHADWVASGISKVCKDGKWGCINMKNEVVVPFEYDDIPEVSFNNENSAIALYTVGKTENDIKKYGIIDGENKNVVPMIFDDLTPVSEEKAFGIYNGEVFSIEIGEKEKTDLSTGKYGVLEYIKIDNDSEFIDRLNNSVSDDGVYDYIMIIGCDKDVESVDVPQEIDGLPVKNNR